MLAEQVLYYLNHTSSPFCSGYFGDGNLVNYLPGLSSNGDLPISDSQVLIPEPPARPGEPESLSVGLRNLLFK
jgi:hypothetical protein